MSREPREGSNQAADAFFDFLQEKLGLIYVLVSISATAGLCYLIYSYLFDDAFRFASKDGMGVYKHGGYVTFHLLLAISVTLSIGNSFFHRGWLRGVGDFIVGSLFVLIGFSVVPVAALLGLSSMAAGNFGWFQWVLLVPCVMWIAYGIQGWICGVVQDQVMVRQGGQAEESPSESVAFPAVRSRLTFADIVGMEDLKARLMEAGKEIRQQNRESRNGILLSGEPGNGKTLFAEALAGELKLPIINVGYGDLASRWVNQTTEQVMALFASARRQSPCLLFIDEIDSLISARDGQSGSEEGPRITNTILTEIVKLRGSGVVLVGATNFLDKLDAAAIREGRFDYKIEVPCPDQPAREAILSRSLAKAGGRGLQIEAGVVERAAKRWVGFSASRIDAVGKEAGKSVAKQGGGLSFDDLMAAMRRIQGRAGKLVEGTPSLAEMSLTAGMRDPLHKLAVRMERIVEIEEMGGTVPRGVLFYGPAGTGKTLTAQALAKTAGWAFLPVQGMDLIRDQEKIEAIFKEAADIRPCVLFIDEADDLLAQREGSPYAAMTNKFLSVMDGAGGKTPDVMVVAATNFPERLDGAALRGGRFTEKIGFETSDQGQVIALVSKWMDNLKLSRSSDLTVEAITSLMVGHSPANIRSALQHAVNEVAARSLTGGSSKIGLDDVEAALNVVA